MPEGKTPELPEEINKSPDCHASFKGMVGRGLLLVLF